MYIKKCLELMKTLFVPAMWYGSINGNKLNINMTTYVNMADLKTSVAFNRELSRWGSGSGSVGLVACDTD
jgi:hypothetical protein